MIRRDLTPVINFLLGVVLHSRRLIEKSKKLQKIIDDETAKRFEEALAKRRHNQCRRPD
jgi:hypothetical protein